MYVVEFLIDQIAAWVAENAEALKGAAQTLAILAGAPCVGVMIANLVGIKRLDKLARRFSL